MIQEKTSKKGYKNKNLVTGQEEMLPLAYLPAEAPCDQCLKCLTTQ